jgi:hypothetical protein
MRTVFRFVHLFSLITWFGGVIFFSTVVAPVIFKTFPLEQAGDVVGVIFPFFYLIGYIFGSVALVSLYFSYRKKPWFRLLFIAVMLVSTLYGGLVAGKKAGELRLQIRQEQDSGQKLVLKENFHAQHRLSMISNSLVLILIPVMTWLTARKVSDG